MGQVVAEVVVRMHAGLLPDSLRVTPMLLLSGQTVRAAQGPTGQTVQGQLSIIIAAETQARLSGPMAVSLGECRSPELTGSVVLVERPTRTRGLPLTLVVQGIGAVRPQTWAVVVEPGPGTLIQAQMQPHKRGQPGPIKEAMAGLAGPETPTAQTVWFMAGVVVVADAIMPHPAGEAMVRSVGPLFHGRTGIS
jgi:hypothetical protein